MQGDNLKDYLLKYKYERNISDATYKNYLHSFKDFCRQTGHSIEELVELSLNEQYDIIEDNKIIRFNPNDSFLSNLTDDYIIASLKEGKSETTIHSYLVNVFAVLKHFGVEVPKIKVRRNAPKGWKPLTKSQIKYVIDISGLQYKTIICLMATTGMRRTDVCNLTINDFMEATYEWHEKSSLSEFLSTAPQDMVGFFDFMPNKTKKNKIRCKVCCTPETSNYVLLMLRERNQRIKDMEKEDALFSNRLGKYKSHIQPRTVTKAFQYYENKLNAEIERLAREKLLNGEIDDKEYHRIVLEKTEFNPHNLRKFFISVVAEHIGNLRVCMLMEGHAPPSFLDKSYVKISNNVIKESYYILISSLTFEDVEVKLISNKEQESLKDRIRQLESENEQIRKNINDEIKKQLQELVYKHNL